MQKKQSRLLIVSLLIVLFAYFIIQVIGKTMNKDVSDTNLQIASNDLDGEIADSYIEPGWQKTKTFTIQNNGKTERKYNIVIKDLMNTFVTKGYLKYKVTSTNNGYNMTEFKDIPKSSAPKDTILAYSASIPVGVTQSYTIEFKYANDGSVDQSDDMGKKLSGTLFITEGTEEPVTLLSQLLADKSTRPGERTDFSTVYTSNNTKTLYTGTENGTTVYYFAGNATDNWVKFGKNESNQDLYWRIIRTNSDGSVRLLYHGTSTTATDTYIGTSGFHGYIGDIAYLSYMYGSLGSISNARTNQTNSSRIKTTIDNWYKDNLNTNYGKYLSTTAVYCNDRSISDNTDFGAYTRLITNKTPTYDCATTEDKFTVDTSTGNGKLTYPIALMTADEVSFAGGVWLTRAETWYYKNSANGSSTGETNWLLLSPFACYESRPRVFSVDGSSSPGLLGNYDVISTHGVRPAISLKSCTLYSTGDGSASDPYTIKETETGC